MSVVTCSVLLQGRHRNFQSGWYKYYCKRSEQKNFGVVPPHMTVWEYNSCRQTGEPIGQHYPGICLPQCLTGHYRPINKHSKWPTRWHKHWKIEQHLFIFILNFKLSNSSEFWALFLQFSYLLYKQKTLFLRLQNLQRGYTQSSN